MDAEPTMTKSGVATRRYTGKTRLEAEAGFKCDWPALSAHYSLLTEAWDDDTHTLTVFLEDRGSGPRVDQR